MSTTYVALDDVDISAGKPVKEEIFQRIKDNQDCFNTDIELLKQTAAIDMFNIKFSGQISQYSLAEVSQRVATWRAPLTGIINQFKMSLITPSLSGTLQVEIDRSVDEGANWTPLLSSPVELTGTVPGSISGNVNFVDPSFQNFNQNDLLRIRIVGVQQQQGEFHLAISGEVS